MLAHREQLSDVRLIQQNVQRVARVCYAGGPEESDP